MKFYIIAGEASGDLHGSYLIKELKKLHPNAKFRCWGGDLMREQGGEIVKHYKDLSFMGFVEVVGNLSTIVSNMKFCKKDILQYNPDAVIFIDYPGFNLPIAKFVHKQKIKTFYYIAPQVWAWKKRRVKTMRKVLTKLFVILPFEKAFFKQNKMDVEFVGHPLLDEIEDFKNKHSLRDDFIAKNELSGKPIIAILPGSRKQEISKMLPTMLSLVKKYPNYQFVIAGMDTLGAAFYTSFMQFGEIKIVYNQTYNLLQHAHAALVTSGTATLETALFNVPEIVCYKANLISILIARSIIKIKYISLVNLIVDKPIVLELIQNALTEKRIQTEFEKIANDNLHRIKMQQNFAELRHILGETGASGRTAERMLYYLTI